MDDLLKQDKMRTKKLPHFQILLRKAQRGGFTSLFYRLLYRLAANRSHIEISTKCKIGGGLYIGHAYCITINVNAQMGRNCNIHKGVTIGQENRGTREGCPTIGDEVWIGINATVVGNVKIGNDFLIAPNTYVNCDIPDHSVVFGNPCIIKHKDNATEGYINNKA